MVLRASLGIAAMIPVVAGGGCYACVDPDPAKRKYCRCDKPSYDSSLPYPHERGTSFATPQVSALAGYVMRQMNCHWPSNKLRAVENARAVLMAGSGRDVKVKVGGAAAQVYRLVTGVARYDEQK